MIVYLYYSYLLKNFYDYELKGSQNFPEIGKVVHIILKEKTLGNLSWISTTTIGVEYTHKEH